MVSETLRALKPAMSQVKPEQCSLFKNILCSSDNQDENYYYMEDHNERSTKVQKLSDHQVSLETPTKTLRSMYAYLMISEKYNAYALHMPL